MTETGRDPAESAGAGVDGGAVVRPGRRLGVDVGAVRIGVATSDPRGLLATPVETVRRGTGDIERLVELAVEHGVVEVVVGLPLSLSGGSGPAAAGVREFVAGLVAGLDASGTDVPVRLVDERLTTVSAERVLREQGATGKRGRAVVDQAAAVVILQHALDAERATGRPPGEEVRR